MKAVIQRVLEASVEVEGKIVGKIKEGILIYLAVMKGDTLEKANALAEKIVFYRIFPDKDHKMNLSLKDIQGEALVISQFTLAADCRKGRRPGFELAASPEDALLLYQKFIEQVQTFGVFAANGIFGASMRVHSINNGPVTFILEI
ncbi:MAG: D-tyrosyl-tRNA(Tyr) deacylase [Candidatus Brocadiae bacterium]|nr:D-tyrosyl-tRNA(Tyr) deacylase [Candidatus Brocadiia bacterium]